MCLCPNVLQKLEFVINKNGYLAKAIFKASNEGTSWLIPTFYTKMQEDRND